MADEAFDYVVVGGGSAGSVIASRLAESGAHVLLLEAGGSDKRLDIRIPAAVASAYKKANWKYPAEPDPSRGNKPEAWMAGKVMGGGGSINSCVFVRGNRADFDGWAALGCNGWDYESVLPSFRRLESWEGGSNAYRGGSGPIAVGVQSNRGQANMAYLKAAQQAGYQQTEDYNGERQDGVALTQVNHRRGTRSQASREYIKRVAPKDKLTVRTQATAHRVLFDGDRATGVQYERDGRLATVLAREEVILSAGSMGSPKILMLSGIGARHHLKEHGLDLVKHVPGVGGNLHEHAFIMQRWHSRIHTLNKPRLGDVLGGLKDYVAHGTGMLALTMVQVQVMAKTDPALPSPDMQLQFAPIAITRDVDENGMFNVQAAKEEGFISSSTFLRTRYRGRISLRSADPAAPPRIEMRLLGDPDDLRDSVAGIKMVHEIMRQPAMKEITNNQFEPESACKTENDWASYARGYAVPSYHPVGTCKMGTDDESVVDAELRVNGVRNLRVVDASIMPRVTSGNTNAPSMMIAERAAELILGRAPR